MILDKSCSHTKKAFRGAKDVITSVTPSHKAISIKDGSSKVVKGHRAQEAFSGKERFYQSPYGDEDFVYKGYKKVKPRLLCANGTGCPEGNKCLNSHRTKWDEKLKENQDRCYVCGLQKSKATNANPPHRSDHCSAPGGGEDMERIRDRVNMWIFKELPLRPGNVKTS